jgi:hypothetical protein
VRILLTNPRWALLLLLALVALCSWGCATTESENMSERPWSAPQSWETGLPSGMMDQRR